MTTGIRRRYPNHTSSSAVEDHHSSKASDALPLPLYLTNAIFFTLFFSVAYFLLHRWREKIRNSTPLHVLTLSELAAVITLFASFIYLLGFFGIDFVQSFVSKNENDDVQQESQHHQHRSPHLVNKIGSPTPVSVTMVHQHFMRSH